MRMSNRRLHDLGYAASQHDQQHRATLRWAEVRWLVTVALAARKLKDVLSTADPDTLAAWDELDQALCDD